MRHINFYLNAESFDCPRSINQTFQAHDCVCCHSPSNLIEYPVRPMGCTARIWPKPIKPGIKYEGNGKQ